MNVINILDNLPDLILGKKQGPTLCEENDVIGECQNALRVDGIRLICTQD